MITMGYNVLKAALAACLSLALLSSCSKEHSDVEEVQQELATAFISFDAGFDVAEYVGDDEEEMRAHVRYEGSANKKGQAHPHMTLTPNSGATTYPMTLVFKNKTSGKSFRQDVNVKPNAAGRYEVEKLGLPKATDAVLAANTGDWYMLIVLGGTFESNKLKFSARDRMPLFNASKGILVDNVYMSTAWTKLNLSNNGTEKIFSVAEVGGKKQDIKLKSRMMTLLFRLESNQTNKNVTFSGVGFSTDNLSFSGEFDFANLDVTKLPTYKAARGSNVVSFYPTVVPTMPANSNQATDYLVATAVPLGDRSNIRIYPYVSARLEWGAYADKLNARVKAGAFAGINDVYVASPTFDHPIEAALTTDGTRVYTTSSQNANLAIYNSTGYTEEGTLRTYALPTIEQMAVFVPGLRSPNKPIPANVHPIMDFGRKEAWSGTEKIAAWSTDAAEYLGDFKPGAGNIFYATRFRDKGSQPHPGKYYSAYRYEKKGDDLHITVRELRLTPKLTLNDIAKESYWNSPVLWNQREYKRIISKGVYWSSSTFTRDLVAKVTNGLKIFTDQDLDQSAAKPNGAFVTSEEFPRFADNPKTGNNTSGKSAILMTTQRVP